MSKMFQFFCAFIACSGTVVANSSFLGQKADTQLIQAVKDGNRKAVKKLLKSGVDVSELGQDHKTALDAAVEYGHTKIALDLGPIPKFIID
jgi:ankyrin repeat protein